MCEFASFVLTKDRALWSSTSDSHEQIIAEHQLRDDAARVLIVRVELTPPADDPRCADLARWDFAVDQDVLPEWTFQGDPSLEVRTRAAAVRRAEREQWFAVAEGPSVAVGYAGTATAGDRGTATAGVRGTATAGVRGTATAGDRGMATAGVRGTATAGDDGTATAGDGGMATAGVRGTATAGDRGTATAGYEGTATAGDRGTATAGVRGTATAGDGGIIEVRWWDCSASRWRLAIGYVGEDGIEPGVAYYVRDGRLVRRDGEP